MGIGLFLKPNLGPWKRGPKGSGTHAEASVKTSPRTTGPVEAKVVPTEDLPAGAPPQSGDSTLVAPKPTSQPGSEARGTQGGAQGEATPTAPAAVAKDAALTDDVMNLFTEDETADEELNRLVGSLNEVDINALVQECRGVATRLSRNRREPIRRS